MAWVARRLAFQFNRRGKAISSPLNVGFYNPDASTISPLSLAALAQPARCCSNYHKQPFLETLKEKVELEGPNAPKWWDDNEEFWRKAEDFVKDYPEVPTPWRLIVRR